MSAWIESHIDLAEHPKLLDLCFALQIKKYEAIGHLTLLWHFALKFAPEDGDLGRFTARSICQAVDWDKDEETLFRNLRETGWLEKDGVKIRNWDQYTAHFNMLRERTERQREQVKTRVQEWRDRRSNAHVTQCNAHTKPNLTKQKDKEAKTRPAVVLIVPEDLKADETAIKDWLEYKQQKGQRYKPKGLEALWRTLRAIPAGARRESIDWSMGNNWAGIFQKNLGGFAPRPVGPPPDANKLAAAKANLSRLAEKVYADRSKKGDVKSYQTPPLPKPLEALATNTPVIDP